MEAIAGVDGCKDGWICVYKLSANAAPALRVFNAFEELVSNLPEQTTITVDIPIGLPDRISGPGRVAEQEVRRLVPGKTSTVFSVPSREAIEKGMNFFEGFKAGRLSYKQAYELTKDVARNTSDPCKSLSRQAFGILPKIAEVDRWIRSNTEASKRVFESHPEVAFAILNSSSPMTFSKKLPEGVAERRNLLASKGFESQFLNQPVPIRTSIDDFLDACAMLLIAGRMASREALPHPSPPHEDSQNIPVAIWA